MVTTKMTKPAAPRWNGSHKEVATNSAQITVVTRRPTRCVPFEWVLVVQPSAIAATARVQMPMPTR